MIQLLEPGYIEAHAHVVLLYRPERGQQLDGRGRNHHRQTARAALRVVALTESADSKRLFPLFSNR
jgi:hypothetical protein